MAVNRLTPSQRTALNNARAEADLIRKDIEKLTFESIDWLEHLSIGTRITNMMYDLEKRLKSA